VFVFHPSVRLVGLFRISTVPFKGNLYEGTDSYWLFPYVLPRIAFFHLLSEFFATDPEARVRLPALPEKKSSESGTGSTQPREYNWGATW
jgi:hypothetical protein